MCKDLAHGGTRCPSSTSAKHGGNRLPEDRVTRKVLSSAPRVASEFHEMWREEYRRNNGDAPRIKTTTDANWIAENGTDQVDIASKQFSDLPRDWRKENRDAAVAATKIVARRAAAGLGTSSRKDIDEMSSEVHAKWLSRANNAYAKSGDLDVPFDKLTKVEKDKDRAQVECALKELSYARRADAILEAIHTVGNPAKFASKATEDMTSAQLKDLANTVDTEIEKQQRRQQRQWESVVNEVGKQNPDLEPGSPEFEKKLTNLVLGDEKPTGALKGKLQRFRDSELRVSNLRLVNLAAQIAEPSDAPSVPKPESKKRTSGRNIAAMSSANGDTIDLWDAEVSKLSKNDVNRAVYIGYGDRAETERLLNGKAPLGEIADEYDRLKESVPATLKEQKQRGTWKPRTESAEQALIAAAAANMLTESGIPVGKKIATSLHESAGEHYISVPKDKEAALVDTLSKHVIESGLLDSDWYDVPNTGTDVDRAKALIGFFRWKKDYAYDGTNPDNLDVHSLAEEITRHYGRKRAESSPDDSFDPNEHMDPLF